MRSCEIANRFTGTDSRFLCRRRSHSAQGKQRGMGNGVCVVRLRWHVVNAVDIVRRLQMRGSHSRYRSQASAIHRRSRSNTA